MSEEKKNAKTVLRELQDKIAQDAWDAKRRGEFCDSYDKF